MRTNAVYKRAYNQGLARLATVEIGGDLGSESQLAESLGISRTTVRTMLATMAAARLIVLNGRQKIVRRHPNEGDYFPETETESIRDVIEKRFMELVLQRDFRPGQQISNLELARQLQVSPSALREYLIEFSQCGLLERRPESRWIFKGFDRDFARELFDVREMFELRSAEKFADLPATDPVWEKLDSLEHQHVELIAEIDTRYKEFSRVDAELHELVNSVARNRFIDNFQTLRSLIFHYHYLWQKDDEKERNLVALKEHLIYIEALRSRDPAKIRAAALGHLHSARQSLYASIGSNGAGE